MNIYRNTIEPTEQYKLVEKIFDLKDSIPLLDPESYYFVDSYKL
jgi:hypothetical protein